MTEPSPERDITSLLQRWGAGDAIALEQLMPLIYEQLRRLSALLLKGQSADQTLQPTALVHEAYLKLAGERGYSFENRVAFFGLAAKAMRQVLVDHARARSSEKRGGKAHRVTWVEGSFAGAERSADLEQLDAALEALSRVDPRKGRIVELRFFGGLKGEEIAAALGIGSATVTRELRLAEAWLLHEMSHSH